MERRDLDAAGRFQLGEGVGSRSGRTSTPRTAGSWWQRLLLGYDRPPLPGIADNDPECDVESGTSWTGYREPPPPESQGERTGVCCSGGGIRAATFCLGGLQALQRDPRYAEVDYLASVSGGGYTCIGETVTHGLTREVWTQRGHPAIGTRLLNAHPRPWALDSPETVNLRNHTRYLAPNLAGAVWGVLVILYGVVRHLLPFAAATVVIGSVYGWALTRLGLISFAGGSLHPTVHSDQVARAALWGVGGCTAVAALLVIARRQQERASSGSPTLHVVVETWAVRFALLAVAGAVLACGVPYLLGLVPHSTRPLFATLGGQVLSIAGLQKIASYARTAASASGRWRKLAVTIGSYVIGPLVLAAGLLLVALIAAQRGPQWDSFGAGWWMVLGAAYIAVNWLFDDEVVSPLHVLYRERLSTAFVRYRVEDNHGRMSTADPPWNVSVSFAMMPDRPKLVVCAAINVSDDVVPPGRYAGSFTFEKDWSGGPLTGYVPTADLERAAGEGVLTMPAMMAVSGAAVSPLMGRDTRPGFRLLMAMFDVRLGMWLPNPRALGSARPPSATWERQEHEACGEKRWGWVDGRSPFLAAGGAVQRPCAYRRPGWSYSLREAFGLNSLRLPYVDVTDGGHWENLGLVELLRRGCTRIVCFDASDDHSNPLAALGQAMSLARDELNVDFDIATADLVPDPTTRLSRKLVVRGRFTYPDGRPGKLIFAKNVLPKDAPRDVLAFAATDPRFPFDTTLNQYFDDQHFDAYRELGYFAGQQALKLW